MGHKVDVISGPPYPNLDSRINLIKLPGLNLFETFSFKDRLYKFCKKKNKTLNDWYEFISVLFGGFPELKTFGDRANKFLNRRRFVTATVPLSSTDGEVLNLGRRGGGSHRREDAELSASSNSSNTREMVRKFKGVETASKAEINKIELARVRKEFAQWSADSGSSGVQIAALTAKIAYMTEHLKLHKKDKHGRLGLSQMLERRKKLLKYLRRTNATTYETVITKLGLKDRSFVEEPLGAKWPTRGGK